MFFPLQKDTYNVNYTAYGKHCHIQDIFRARVIKSQLGEQPLLIAKALYRLSSACMRVVSTTTIAALWKHTKSQRGNTFE